MEYKVIITRTAIEDLKDQLDFIRADDPQAAVKLGEKVLHEIELLAPFPRLGRKLRESGLSRWREVLVKPLRIIYRVAERKKMVYVSRIWHGARGRPRVKYEID